MKPIQIPDKVTAVPSPVMVCGVLSPIFVHGFLILDFGSDQASRITRILDSVHWHETRSSLISSFLQYSLHQKSSRNVTY
jgi:hypothetical protein